MIVVSVMWLYVLFFFLFFFLSVCLSCRFCQVSVVVMFSSLISLCWVVFCSLRPWVGGDHYLRCSDRQTLPNVWSASTLILLLCFILIFLTLIHVLNDRLVSVHVKRRRRWSLFVEVTVGAISLFACLCVFVCVCRCHVGSDVLCIDLLRLIHDDQPCTWRRSFPGLHHSFFPMFLLHMCTITEP